MSPAKLSALARRLRAERGQTSVEYVGVFLVACAIVAVLLNAGIGDLLAAKLKAQIVAVSTDQESGGGGSSKGGDSSGGSGGPSDGGSGGAGGGSETDDEAGGPGQPPGAGGEGPPGAGSKPGVPGGGTGSTPADPNQPPGSGGAPPGALPPGGKGPPDKKDLAKEEPSPWPCLSATFGGVHGCASAALGLPAYLSKSHPEATAKALARTERMLEKAKPGTMRSSLLLKLRDRQERAVETAQRLQKDPRVRAGNLLKQVVNGSPTDAGKGIAKGLEKAGLRDRKDKIAQAKAASTAPSSRSAARNVLSSSRKTLGNVVKGAGIVGP